MCEGIARTFYLTEISSSLLFSLLDFIYFSEIEMLKIIQQTFQILLDSKN